MAFRRFSDLILHISNEIVSTIIKLERLNLNVNNWPRVRRCQYIKKSIAAAFIAASRHDFLSVGRVLPAATGNWEVAGHDR
jgi:hypothetical protein